MLNVASTIEKSLRLTRCCYTIMCARDELHLVRDFVASRICFADAWTAPDSGAVAKTGSFDAAAALPAPSEITLTRRNGLANCSMVPWLASWSLINSCVQDFSSTFSSLLFHLAASAIPFLIGYGRKILICHIFFC